MIPGRFVLNKVMMINHTSVKIMLYAKTRIKSILRDPLFEMLVICVTCSLVLLMTFNTHRVTFGQSYVYIGITKPDFVFKLHHVQ